MKSKQCCKSFCRSFMRLLAYTSVVITTSSCNDASRSSDPPEQSDVPSLEASTSYPLSPPQVPRPETPVLEQLHVDSNSLNSQYPIDTGDDDRPGLIITGLDNSDIQTLESPFLLSASAFRMEKKTPGSGDGSVHMVVYDEAMPVSAHLAFYQPVLNSCVIRDLQGDNGNASDVLNTSASGGAGIVINSQSGPWFTFDRKRHESGHFMYQVDNQLPGRFPLDATVSVPGDVFPGVSAHPVFEPEAPVRVLPARGRMVTPESAFSWLAGPASGYVKINLLAYDYSNEFLGFAVTCWVEDDGQFEMPSAVKEYVQSSDLLLRARYSRVYARLDWINAMVIHQEIEVAE